MGREIGQYSLYGEVLRPKLSSRRVATLTLEPRITKPPLASSDLFTDAQIRQIDGEISKKLPTLRIISMGRRDKNHQGKVEVKIPNRFGVMSSAVLLQDAIVSVRLERGNRHYVRVLTTEATVSVQFDGEDFPHTVLAGELLVTKAKKRKINAKKVSLEVWTRLRMPHLFPFFRKLKE